MKTEKTCRGCGETKKLEEFPTRGSETDRFGAPIYRGKCKVCDSQRNIKKYHQQKAIKVADAVDDYIPVITKTEYPEYIPKSRAQGKYIKSDDDYGPWEEVKNRPLNDEEKDELDACARELIIAFMNLVIKEKGVVNE